MVSLDITIPLSDWQRSVLLDKHRFKVVCSGRQAGKSHMAGAYAIIKCLQRANSVVWVVSPSFRQSGFLFDKITGFCNDCKIPVSTKRSQQEMSVTFNLNGSIIQAVSADDPDKLRGATLDAVIVDEAAMVKNGIFDEHIRPMLLVKNGEALIISTPKGRGNWFADAYFSKDEDYEHFHFTSADNPYIPERELERAKANTDELTFRQEYLAEFLDDGGLVFTHFVTQPVSRKPVDGHSYMAGLDLAKSVDFTVLTIADIETKEIVDTMRMSDLSWESQIFAVKEYLKRYNNPVVYVDSTGVGDPIVERLINEGVEARGVTFSSKSKQQMVQNLAVALQKEEMAIPDETVFKNEVVQFSFEHTATGQFKYGAPPGKHDDCVASLCLLAWGLFQCASDIGFYYEEEESNIPKDYDEEEFDWKLDNFDWDWDTDIPESHVDDHNRIFRDRVM